MKRILWTVCFLILITGIFTACGRADNFYKNGKKSLKDGDYAKAAECFASAVSINPNQAEYFIDYGLALIQLGEYENAISVFERAYMNKDMSIVRENDKKVLCGKGIAYYHMGEYASCVQEFENALKIKELSEMNTDIILYMACAHQAEGQYDKAIDELSQLLLNDSKNAFVYAKRAECYRLMADMANSLADFNKAIELEPGNYEYYFAKYYLLEEMGDASGAKAVLEEADKLELSNDRDKYYKALIHYYKGQYDIALVELEECLANEDIRAAYYIGEIYRIRKDYTNAIYYYEKAINDSKVQFSNVFNQIAVCLMKTGAYEEALKYIEKGLSHKDASRDRILRKNEIIAYEYLGRYEEASVKLDEYIKDYPQESEAIREAEFVAGRLEGSSNTFPEN